MSYKKFTPDHLKAYQQDGYVIIRELFNTDEVSLLLETYKNDNSSKNPPLMLMTILGSIQN